MQTLVHEMVHCWQHCFGTPGRAYYHNKEWAIKMIEVGLMPSSTGEPAGRITGQFMSDFIIEDGKFIEAFHRLETDKAYQLKWIDRRSLPRMFEPVSAPVPSETLVAELDNGTSTENSNPSALVALAGTAQLSASTAPQFSEVMPTDFLLPEVVKRKTRYRYLCHGCGTKVYGKAHLNINCNDCDQPFECTE